MPISTDLHFTLSHYSFYVNPKSHDAYPSTLSSYRQATYLHHHSLNPLCHTTACHTDTLSHSYTSSLLRESQNAPTIKHYYKKSSHRYLLYSSFVIKFVFKYRKVMERIYQDLTQLIGNTPLVQLNNLCTILS